MSLCCCAWCLCVVGDRKCFVLNTPYVETYPPENTITYPNIYYTFFCKGSGDFSKLQDGESTCVRVRVYVCMYACMYVCMHACMYVCMYVCVYVYVLV